jgi:hypothetical protein
MTPDRIIHLAQLGGPDELLNELLAEKLGVQPDDPNSKPLVNAAIACLRQVTAGKGKDRHQRGRDFVDQPIMVIPHLLSGHSRQAGLGALLYQSIKKSEEAIGLPHDRMIAELQGAVIYLLAAVMFAVETKPEQ